MTRLAGARSAARERAWLARARHLVRTPKGSLLLILGVLTIVAAVPQPADRVLPPLIASLATALLVDVPVLRWTRRRWLFPDGALITALLVTLVVSPYDAWWIAAAATGIGLASKHLVRWRGVNVLNPAAVGLLVSYYAFNAAHSWWGALPDAPSLLAWSLLLPAGIFIVDRVNRAPMVLAFLVTYFGLFAALAYIRDAAVVGEIFVAPDLHAAVFFAAFMVSDPPTSPARWSPQVAAGALVAATCCGLFMLTGGAYYLAGGLLAGNVVRGAGREL